HSGHLIDPALRPYLQADDATLRRDEDPLTGIWASVGDDLFRTHTSRFQIDLNRPREKAFNVDPQDTWGIRFYRERPPEILIDRLLEEYDTFYASMKAWIESSIAEHGRILLLDFHSYNHCRGQKEAPQPGNPDIDLGMTTFDPARFESVGARLQETLNRKDVAGRALDVRTNVRYPDGGHFPEWVFANYGENVCTITLEVKKFYMDERTAMADLRAVDDLLQVILDAKVAAVAELLGKR